MHITELIYYSSPIGILECACSETGISCLLKSKDQSLKPSTSFKSAILKKAIKQLDKYFEGSLRSFDLPLDFGTATSFYQSVWNLLLTIPYGETRSYGELATALGDINKSRAVGLANGRNPIAIIVPCHRVIGQDGSLTGYGLGLDAKEFLLQLENPNRWVKQGKLF